MQTRNLRPMAPFGIVMVIVLGCSGLAHAQWSGLTNAMPNNNPDTCLLLTDGTAMCHEYSTNHWHRLSPDASGSYQNGKWDTPPIADMPNGVDTSGSCPSPGGCTYAPLYFASAVLPDGRVVVIGGEDNPGTSGNGVETNIGFLYNPVTDSWSTQLTEPFGTGNFGDAISVVLQDGTMVVGSINNTVSTTGPMASFSPSTLTFTALNDTGKLDSNSEEGWTILPNGKVLAVDAGIANSFEIYDPNPTVNAWTSPAPGTTAGLTLADTGGNCRSIELGPTVALPNGTIIQFSGGPSGKNGIYDITSGTWSHNVNLDFPPGPGTEGQLTVSDGPASLLPNGHAVVMASPGCKATGATCTVNGPGCTCTAGLCYTPFNSPSHIYDWDGTTLNEVTTSGSGFANVTSYDSYQGRMLLLPTGEVLVVANNQGGTQTVELYTGAGGPKDAWRPVITGAPHSVDPGKSYSISGMQFNGFSQGATYGDNAQMATNYPLVRITNPGTGHVFYARTHNHSRMGVEAVGSTEIETTTFDAPNDPEIGGVCDLEVVTNGIPSKKFTINGPGLSIPGPLSLKACMGSTATTTLNVCNTGKANLSINNITSLDPQFTIANPGFSLTISPDFCFPFQVTYTPTTTGTTNSSLTILSDDPNDPSATVQISGHTPAPSINATIVNSGNFGNVCPSGQSNLTLQITNQSECNLNVSAITSNNAEFLSPTLTRSPLILTADATVDLPISFQPTAAHVCSDSALDIGTITVASDDPTKPTLSAGVQGIVPCPHINSTFANSGSYGNVCAGNHEDMNLQLLNTGQCNLNISSITSSNASGFVLPAGTTFPLVLSADANVNVPVRFIPSGACSNTLAQFSTITVNSNDPGGALTQSVSGIEGCPKLVLSPQNLTGAFAFPATVSDPQGTLGCYTDRQITVSNSGICPLTITSLTTANGLDGIGAALPGAPLEFNVVNPTVPISLGPGAGPVPITVRFRPLILTDQNSMAPDQQTGTLNIVSNDPTPADNTAGLCGEPAYHSGARVLVVNSSSLPVNPVKSLALSSKGLTPPFSETLSPAAFGTANVCGNLIQYQLDNETLRPAGTTGNSPRASYVLSAKQNSTQANMSFTLGQCEMKQIVLQLK